MKKLFLIDGAAGLIKSDLIQFILSKENSILVDKYSTRIERNTDSKNIDLNFISNEEFSKIEKECYCYNYGKKDDGYGIARYGIPKKSLMGAVNLFENVFVIVRNLDCINEITKDYSKKVKVISVLIYADKQFTEERLKLVGREDEIPTRLNRMNQVINDYFSELNFFNKTILLNDASEEHLKMQLNQLIKECEIEPYNSLYVSPNQSYNLIKPLIGYKENICLQLNKFPFEKNIFLMMKFRDDNRCNYTNTKIYDIICETVENAGFRCVRADQREWTHLTDESAYNPLAVSYCCKYGIALIDMPEEGAAYNSNVIYELGMMATQNKSCILLRDETVEKIPFDLITTIHRTYNPQNYDKDIRLHLKSWLIGLERINNYSNKF